MTEAHDYMQEPTGPRGKGQDATVRQPPRFSGSNRYSLFVNLMKVMLPAMAAALILLVVVWPQLEIDGKRFRIGVSKLSLDQVDTLSMLNARFEGLDAKNQPFSVTADVATQSASDKDLVELQSPKADIALEDGTWMALTAQVGNYRREAQLLDLNGAVNLFHDRGFEIKTEAAQVDLAQASAEGVVPVEGQGPSGSLQAEGFRILDRGMRIIFTGKSRLVILPAARESIQ